MPAHMRSALKGTAVAGRPSPVPRSSLRRRITVSSPARAQVAAQPAPTNGPPPPDLQSARVFPHSGPGDRWPSKAFFDATGILWVSLGSDKPPDPNKAKLGRTLRILQERLPTLLQSPLPQDILAPNISLHLFPSTHPHLPTVSGRVAYNAALWTSPIAWNRVPIIGNVGIDILAERMTTEPLTFLPRRPGAIPEQLVVRWSEKCKRDRKSDHGGIAASLNPAGGVDASRVFTGLFIFDFDNQGRILSHTIETAQEGGNWEQGVGAKVVGLTDWLLGGMREPGGTPAPMFERRRFE